MKIINLQVGVMLSPFKLFQTMLQLEANPRILPQMKIWQIDLQVGSYALALQILDNASARKANPGILP